MSVIMSRNEKPPGSESAGCEVTRARSACQADLTNGVPRGLLHPGPRGNSSGVHASSSLPPPRTQPMASNASFDVSTGADLQEVDNAVNQTLKEIAQRYDFKGTHCTVDFDRVKAEIRLSADDEYRMDALVDVLKTKMIKRGVPVKNLKLGDIEPATGQSVRRTLTLTQGIPQDVSKRIVKAIKDQAFKKVQAAIQGDEVRVTAPSRDELQAVIAFLKGQDFGIELTFGNYRG
jgi:uncharacterized protein YajQ (UPF0234 family)